MLTALSWERLQHGIRVGHVLRRQQRPPAIPAEATIVSASVEIFLQINPYDIYISKMFVYQLNLLNLNFKI